MQSYGTEVIYLREKSKIKGIVFTSWKFLYEDVKTGDQWFERIREIRATRISQFRKGLAIYSYSFPSWDKELTDSYIVNEKKEVIYHTQNSELNEIDHPYLIRAFGGFYVSYRAGHKNYRTFPGQDRDTEYQIYPIIKDILDEDGKKISDKDTFLIWHKIVQCKEIADGIVGLNGKQYLLEDYSSHLFLDENGNYPFSSYSR